LWKTAFNPKLSTRLLSKNSIMKTNTLVNRLSLSLIVFFLAFLTVGATGQTLTVYDIPDQTINLGQSFSTINLDNYIDVPGNQLHKIQWSTSGSDQLAVNIDNDRNASVIPPSGTWTGSETITFHATDTDMNTGSDAATFTIKELVNAAPVVSGIPDQILAEGSAFQPVILDNYVTDADNTNDQLTWSASGNSSLSVNINPSTHTATIGVPNIDWNGSETIVFKATDPSLASSQDDAIFTLTPVNDPPVVSNIPDQSIKTGESFAPIALDNYVTDVDNSKSDLIWTITGNTNLIPSVDGSHIATINKPSNWHSSEKLTFTVKDPANASASDNATFTLRASPPTDILLSNSSVDENQPVTTVVGSLSTVDADGGDTFTYTLVPGAGSVDNLSFDISGSNLVTNEIFDFETQTTYHIRVRSTTDGDGLYTEKAFTITINNVNEAPTNITLSNNTVPEHRPANTVVGNLGTTDPDAGDSFTYTLTSGFGSDDNASFNISGNTLRATSTLNFETKSSYTVRIRSTDASSAFTEKQFTITVTNINETPTDISISDNAIAENQPANTVVGTLSTTDLDIGDSFIYTLVSGTGSADNASFNISGNNLRATASLNFETKASYTVRIRTTDAANAFFEKAFTVVVTNVNETPTDIVLSDNTVLDHQPVNTVVGTLSSTDPDVGDIFTYSLVSGTGSTDNASFNISGNQLRTSAIFDFNTKSSYSIRLRTTDAGSAFFEKIFTIIVTSSNSAPTDISLSSNSIAENQPANSTVGNLSATDPDVGETFVFTLVSGAGSTDNGSFNILGTQLRANSPLNYEVKSSYSVRVRVTDAASATFEKSFVITVLNVNEPPVILSANYTADGRIGVLHTGSFTGYSDPEGDPAGVHTYQWYTSDNVSGTPAIPITGATGLTYRPVSSDGGKYLCFEITPVDIFGAAGIPVKSPFRKVNDAPVATSAHVYAPVSLPGQTIRGRFTYSDAEGNPRGNAIYQWYRKNTGTVNYSSPGTPIGTDSTYLLKNTDAGKYIWFKVKPVATSGSTPGDSTWSNIIGQIGTFNASISGTAGYCSGITMPITLTITGGVSPYTAVLTRSGSSSNKDTTITGIADSPHNILVKLTGTYVLKSVTDASTPTPDNATITPDAVVLTAYSKPSGVLSGGAAICNDGAEKSGVTVNLSGTSPWTYTIRRGSAGNDTTFTGITSDPHTFNTRITSSPMTVRLIAISDAHCTGDTTGSGTLRISYLPSPTASIQGQDTICPGGTSNLRVTITGTTGPWSITYLKDGANPTVVNPILVSPYTLVIQGTGTYSLSKVQQLSTGGCTGRVSGTGKIISYIVPTAVLSGTSTFCEFTTGNLNINLTGNSPWKFSYKLNSETPVEVLNVTSSPNTVPISKAGTYTLVDVYDENCKGTTSGSADVTITPAPTVSLSGLAPAYNKDSSQMIHLIGTPPGGTFSGPGVIPYFNDWYFLTSLPPAGTHHIVYSYRESPASCYGYDTATVRVMEANAIIEFPENRLKYCLNDAPFTVTGVNLADNLGSFVISGGRGLVDHGDNTATVDPSKLSVKEYTITYTYFDGTTLIVKSTFEVGSSPVADFHWKSECFESGQSIQFKGDTISTFGNITAYHWKIYTSTGFDSDSTPQISHTFPEYGNHVIELQVETSYGCSSSVTKVFDLRPTINPKTNGFITETFESAPLSWRSETPPTSLINSWTLGNPDDPSGIHGAYSDTSCWYTKISGTNAPREQSWVSSPCYDFTGMNRPMVKMRIWRDFNGRRDGAVLQATTDSAKSWFNIGQMEDGQNWFNEYSILGNPGNQSIGWSAKQDDGWIESRHSLDMLKGKTRVQFRIAYGSDGTVQNTDGFAFDNFWIGERNRIVLVEHFTNSSDAASSEADAKLNALVDPDSLNTIDLQYHTSFPGSDPFNEQEPYAPLSRLTYYGISEVPYAILNGGYVPDYWYNYGSNDLNSNAVHLESLNDAKFGLEFSQSSWEGNNLRFTIQFQPKQDMPAREFTVHAGVLERRVTRTNPNGETIYENVVRTLLPNLEGIPIFEIWPAGMRKEGTFEWEIPEGYNRDQLMAFAFIQDEETHEIFQANIVKIGNITGTHDVLPGSSRDKFIVFPNPASDQAFVRFDEPVKGDVRIEMFNNLGSLVYNGIIPRTDTDSEIRTDKYPDGLYIIRVTTGNELLGITKLNITH
jgi:mRNA-degrading endonuclease HigB of HigAB toxin-antitoxin module